MSISSAIKFKVATLTCSEIGITRFRDVRPTLGLMPARLFFEDGDTIEPSVSVPKDASASPSEEATPDPDELPLGSCFG
jgi:hypothetical protein